MELETHHGPRRMMLLHKKSSPPQAASTQYNACSAIWRAQDMARSRRPAVLECSTKEKGAGCIFKFDSPGGDVHAKTLGRESGTCYRWQLRYWQGLSTRFCQGR